MCVSKTQSACLKYVFANHTLLVQVLRFGIRYVCEVQSADGQLCFVLPN